jgi:hypothetical protein
VLQLPRLAWLCFSGNPVTTAAEERALCMIPEPCAWHQLQLHERLGEGASGVTHRATLHSGSGQREVAVKVFESGLVTSDGRPQSEVAAWTLAGTHPSVIPVLCSVAGAPGGVPALLMPVVDRAFAAVAAPPSMDSCTRDVYVPNFFAQ